MRDGGVDVLLGRAIRSGSLEHLVLAKRPCPDRFDLEWIEDRHRHGVGPLVGQMAPDARADALARLPDIDRFTIVIEESVHAPFDRAQSPFVRVRTGRGERAFEERLQSSAEFDGVERRRLVADTRGLGH